MLNRPTTRATDSQHYLPLCGIYLTHSLQILDGERPGTRDRTVKERRYYTCRLGIEDKVVKVSDNMVSAGQLELRHAQ